MSARDCPDFIIAGSAKSGTTALFRMLDQHPDVFMSPIKETNYFMHGYEQTRHFVGLRQERILDGRDDEDIIDSPEKYRRLFDGAGERKTLGEASPWYLINDAVPARVRSYRDDMKIVIILRNPADVAFANFVHLVRERGESVGIEDIQRIFDESHYAIDDLYPLCRHLQLPRYGKHLPPWLAAFEQGRVHLMVYEEFLTDRRSSLSGLFNFLGLSDEVSIDVERRVNVSGLPKSSRLQELLHGSPRLKSLLRLFMPKKQRRKLRGAIEAMNTGERVQMTPDIRGQFDALYGRDIDYVERILERELPVWRNLQVDQSGAGQS